MLNYKIWVEKAVLISIGVFIAFLLVVGALWLLENPGGISDEEYAEYNALAAPKILYSCVSTPTDTMPSSECSGLLIKAQSTADLSKYHKCKSDFSSTEKVTTSYVAGVGVFSTYNKIYTDIQNECSSSSLYHRRLEVLKSLK